VLDLVRTEIDETFFQEEVKLSEGSRRELSGLAVSHEVSDGLVNSNGVDLLPHSSGNFPIPGDFQRPFPVGGLHRLADMDTTHGPITPNRARTAPVGLRGLFAGCLMTAIDADHIFLPDRLPTRITYRQEETYILRTYDRLYL
jgi:hypothetical protein